MTLLGAVAPWPTSPDETFNGFDGAGTLVAVLGVPALLLGALQLFTSKRPRPHWALILCLIAGVLCAFMTLGNGKTVEDILDSPLAAGSGASIGWGLIPCSLASVSPTLSCLYGFGERREETAAPLPGEA